MRGQLKVVLEGKMNKSMVRNFLFINLGVSLALIASYAIVSFVFTPIQDLILPNWGQVVSLLFLPSGVRIVSVSVFGIPALIAILLSQIFCGFYFWGIHDLNLAATLSLASTGAVYVAFYTTNLLGIPVFLSDTLPRLPKTGHLILATVLASALNGILVSIFLQDFSSYKNGGLIALLYVVGDVMGALVFFAVVYFVFNKINAFTRRNL